MSKRQTILIYRTGQLGDTLVALPAIQTIRERHPRHRLVLLTDRHENTFISSWDILSPTGWFDEAIFYHPRHGIGDKMQNTLHLLKRLRLLNPEYIFNLSPERSFLQQARDAFFFRYLTGTRNYIHRKNAASARRRTSADGRLPRVEPEWQQLMKAVDQKAAAVRFHLTIPDEERKRAQDLLSAEGIGKQRRLVAIGPGSKMPSKVWPRDRYAELGKKLLGGFSGIELVVLGGKEDGGIGDHLCAKWGPRSHNLAGKLTVYGSAAVLEQCILYTGNDTGTMHMGGMVGIPCVAIFSARDYPGKWEPYGVNHRIIRKDIECAGCMLEVCAHDNSCLKQISVDEVFEEAKGLMRL